MSVYAVYSESAQYQEVVIAVLPRDLDVSRASRETLRVMFRSIADMTCPESASITRVRFDDECPKCFRPKEDGLCKNTACDEGFPPPDRLHGLMKKNPPAADERAGDYLRRLTTLWKEEKANDEIPF